LTQGISMATAFLLMLLASGRKRGIELDWDAIVKGTAAALCMYAVVSVVQLVNFNSCLLPAYILLGLVSYVIFVRLLRLPKQQDFELARQVLGERLSVLVDPIERILS